MRRLVISVQLSFLTHSLDEIYASVNHVEPWQTGTSRNPSTAFCLLVKFFLMRLTRKQMVGLLNTDDCPFVRCIGFLYLRYSCPPKDLWAWYEPYLEDPEEFAPFSNKSATLTMGQYLIRLLTDLHYCNTTFPRIPVPIERGYKVLLLMLTQRQERRVKNQKYEKKGLFCQGAKVTILPPGY
jgi:pre-mRNA-splicing factor 38B